MWARLLRSNEGRIVDQELRRFSIAQAVLSLGPGTAVEVAIEAARKIEAYAGNQRDRNAELNSRLCPDIQIVELKRRAAAGDSAILLRKNIGGNHLAATFVFVNIEVAKVLIEDGWRLPKDAP